MQDDLSTIPYQAGTAERLQRLREHEAAWREVTWSGGGVITHKDACDLPTAISGSVLAFLKQNDGDSNDADLGDRLFLLRIPSKLRGIAGESWELSGLGEMSNLCIDAAQDLLLFYRYVTGLNALCRGMILMKRDLKQGWQYSRSRVVVRKCSSFSPTFRCV